MGVLVYYAIGWGLMYGSKVAGLFGADQFFLLGGAYVPDSTLEMDFLFQAMFAATAATIVSGAVAERIKVGSYLVFAAAMTAVIYPIVGAWTWGGGWLDQLGFADFAGSTIVHATGGFAGLAGAIILGPRLGRYARDGRPRAIPGHAMPLMALDVLLQWFGWFGFNGGSVLAVDTPLIASVLVTTSLAAASGGLAAALYTRARYGKFDVAMTGNGILAGLVGITAGADVVAGWAAIAVGLLAGVLVAAAVTAFDRIRIDDPVGAISVHGTCGIWDVLAVLLSNEEATWTGQLTGLVVIFAWVFLASIIVWYALKVIMAIRVSDEEEYDGLDLHECGMEAYPEFAKAASAPHEEPPKPGLGAMELARSST